MNKWETIIKDKNETIKRLQEELSEQSDFIFELMKFIENYRNNKIQKTLKELDQSKGKIKRNIHQDNYATACSHEYLPYDTKVCPHCGGRIKHPYTGEVTPEQVDEDINTCLLMEVIDEYDNTLGYEAICKKDWKHETVTTSNNDISLKEIKDCFEQFKPLMRERLMEQAIKDLDRSKLEEQIRNYLEENTDLIKPEKHIEVYVHASAEQIKEGKITVSLIALDDYGKEMIRKIHNNE